MSKKHTYHKDPSAQTKGRLEKLHHSAASSITDPHYPQGDELTLYDIPHFLRSCIDCLRDYGIGCAPFAKLTIAQGVLTLHIAYFSQLERIADADCVRRGSDSDGNKFEEYRLMLTTNTAIAWVRELTFVRRRSWH